MPVKTAQQMTTVLIPHGFELLIAQRNEARVRRDFTAADTIREQLGQAGVVIEDSVTATTWCRSTEAIA